MRSSTYGIQPTCPSEYAMVSSGKRASVPENTKSSNDPIAFWNVSTELTMNGASGVVPGIFDDEPMCMQSTVSVSWHAAKSGSQMPECTEPKPSGYGFSLKLIAWLPFAAQR